MNAGCPNIKCISFQSLVSCKKDGFYCRLDDSRKIQRYKCQKCGRKFSASTHTLEWRQKKRRVNIHLFRILASGVSMRRAALIINIHRSTVERKLIYLAKKSRQMHEELMVKLNTDKSMHIQFDDLITTEHTKLKPLSITLAVDAKRRYILGTEVSQIPAFGHLSSLSKKKYGKRISTHKLGLHNLLAKIKDNVDEGAKVESDEHHLYAQAVARYFPKARYTQYKGGRGAIVGQGELKKLRSDPLFMLNHTCAMLRANINRLIRKTWCTTKDPKRLQDHLDIYTSFHNYILLKKNS